MIYAGHRATAATASKDDAFIDRASVDNITGPNMSASLVRPPVFYKNKFGVVMNRRQFRSFYHDELISGRPIRPHIFVRR